MLNNLRKMKDQSWIALSICVLVSVVAQLKASSCFSSRYRLNAYSLRSYSLSSPNYPWYYNSNQNCHWYIAAPSSSMVVKITFTYFSLQPSSSCYNDYVEVRDGSFSYSTVISRFCGTKRPPIIISKGQYLYIKFHSDFSMQYKGFHLTYTAVYKASPISGKCSSTYSFAANNDIRLTSERGTIYSPNYPFYYPNNIQCTWKITAPSGKTIRLYFDYMSMESTILCTSDYLQVRNGYFSTSPLKGVYCGSERTTIYSSGRYLWIRFRSDQKMTYKGFKLSYSVRESSSSSTGLIIGILVAIAIIVALIVGVVYCMKKKRTNGVVVRNTAPSTVTTTTVTTTGAISGPSGPPPYEQQNPYPQKGEQYPGPPPTGQPNLYQGLPPAGQPNPYPGPPPAGQPNPYPGPPPAGQPNPYSGPPPAGPPNPYSGPPPAGPPNPYSGPPPAGQPNPYPGPPQPYSYPAGQAGPPVVSL